MIEQLTAIFDAHPLVVLWFSGGKDSTALLHMCRPWRHQVIVLHSVVEPDQEWPGVRAHVERCLDDWGYVRSIYVEPYVTFDDYVTQYGWQTDMVPTALDGAIQPPSPYMVGDVKFSSWWHCSLVRGLLPLLHATLATRTGVMLTGSRAADGPEFARRAWKTESPELTRYDPLRDWTSDQVYAYIDAHAIPLPPHYHWKRGADFEAADCMGCAWQPQHWHILKAHYPDEFARRWPIMQPVFAALKAEHRKFGALLAQFPDSD
jgi:3'-phosphoadenosine 5'-phosphosulfate sulfotransferase (PAPS reductase)/FAD synthetase